MCPNDSAPSLQPLLPQRWDSLFDSEAGSDVTFLVGPHPETWRFPGHRAILSDANPVFRAMLNGPLADSGPTVAIHDVDGRAFDHLLRFLYREDVHLQSVSTALATLYAAHKYLCAGLMRTCITYLDDHLTAATVLQIYQHIRMYCDVHPARRKPEEKWEASAPPLDDNIHMMTCLCSDLHHNCLQFIDAHADKVLAEESVEDVTLEALREISQRDSLMLSSEAVLFSALERWCNRECKRCQLELSAENRRSVLGEELLFSVRYLLMTSQQFLSGPMQSGLLDQYETTVLLGHILNSPVSASAQTLTQSVLDHLKRSRRLSCDAPIVLSDRSALALKTNLKTNKKNSKTKKKSKQKKQKETDGSPKKKCTSSCFFEYVIGALACLFD
ncbi:BTB/POZ domain-containing protein 2-like [Nilaparvata lugens]|uniref:BTB/POZ domain-containing protein 2-like n=1 Tax=Nilaparvata lugens TaxID=108931 RepID=UPI00193D278A|nr:BTB/POZ domain-containing protein 2-like [Nilaparvata lugens]